MIAIEGIDGSGTTTPARFERCSIVVSDRYLLSSLAYQAEEADVDWVSQLARGVRPADLTILLDIPVEVAAARPRQAGRPVERYDADATLARVAETYRRLARLAAGAVILDGSAPVENVTDAILAVVDERLALVPAS